MEPPQEVEASGQVQRDGEGELVDRASSRQLFCLRAHRLKAAEPVASGGVVFSHLRTEGSHRIDRGHALRPREAVGL